MYNLTDFLFYTGVEGVVSYRNRFSEHNIDIGVISNKSLCRVYNMYKAAKIKQNASEKWKYVLYDMFKGIYYTRVPSWKHSLVIFAIFVRNGQKSLPEY